MVLSLNERMDMASTSGIAPELSATVENELYNFGQAPIEVIQRFQDFCMDYTSLTGALIDLISRESLLTKKYHFMSAPVMYQMLARPTEEDSDTMLHPTIDLLKKFTRRGRYDSVSNAIEELLIAPTVQENHPCDKGTWTEGNIKRNYTELSENEQSVLEKIADALLNKLSTGVKKRRSPAKPKKDTNRDQNAKRKAAENNVNFSSPKAKVSEIDLFSMETEHPEMSRFTSHHLCPVKEQLQPIAVRDPIDAFVAVPIKNFAGKISKKARQKKTVSAKFDIKSMKKAEFLEFFFHLRPSC